MYKSIKEMRHCENITQADLASNLKITVVTVSRWENGKSKPSKWFLEILKTNYNCIPQ